MTGAGYAASWQLRPELAAGSMVFVGNTLKMRTAHRLREFESASGRGARLDHALEYSF